MKAGSQPTISLAFGSWQAPIHLENYNRGPLTEEEREALEQYVVLGLRGASPAAVAARQTLARFETPMTDVFHLRNQGGALAYLWAVHRFMRYEMYRHGKMFWDWKRDEWLDTLCPTTALFHAKHGKFQPHVRMVVMGAAYLLGGINDLRSAGIIQEASEIAAMCFGAEWIAQQCTRVLDMLTDKGYRGSVLNMRKLRETLSMLFLLKRTPYLEDISEALLAQVASEGRFLRQGVIRIRPVLQDLDILSPEPPLARLHPFHADGMAQEWHEWCTAWYALAVNLSPIARRNQVAYLLAIGRWLHQHAPEIHTPEQWTEDLALRFRSDLCSWVGGQYSSSHAYKQVPNQGKPLSPSAIHHYLAALRRFLTDLTRRPHTVGEAPGRKIWLDFSPKEVLTTPNPIKRALDEADPRDIDLRVWAKLVIAAATLSESDLPRNTHYSLSFYRALGLVWVTSARRPNEILRLRLDCLREAWDPEMRDEDNHPLPQALTSDSSGTVSQNRQATKAPRMFYLHIPSGKNRGAFWIWIPDYVADTINDWKRERPRFQHQLLDRKDRKEVDYLFCMRNQRVGNEFINHSLIPVLCAKAGVESSDAKGRITGHRGRSSRLTLLRNKGVSLEDLAEYAGHVDTQTIRRYARQDPILLHRIIKDADDLSRIIEGVVDLQAAAAGLPALRWFIGYAADGEPMYCGNQVYITCPHRLDCERCGMFIGGEKARLLHEGEQTLPITSKVPMTPLEKCVVGADQAGAQAYRAALQQIPAPETPDIRLIFNPEGLSNNELEKLAELTTAESLEKLCQALDAHEKKLTEMQQQHKTGRNALVTAQKKRISFIQELIVHGEQRLCEQPGNPGTPISQKAE